MAKSNFPLRARLTGATYRIVPTGAGGTDTVEFGKLVDRIIASNKPGVIEIADNATPLICDAAVSGFANGKQILGQVRIKGETPYATLQLENGFLLNWGGFTNNLIPTTSVSGLSYYARGAFDGVAAKATTVVVTNSGWLQTAGIAVGDTISLSSEDQIVGADPHISGGQNHPGEMHIVTSVAHDTTVVSSVTVPRTTLKLAWAVADTMTTNPQLCKIGMLSNCGLHDLTLHTTKGTNVSHVQTTNVQIRRCSGFVFENVYAEKMGTVAADLCTDFRMAGYRQMDSSDPQGDYGVIIGAVHGFKVNDCTWYNVRHATTTGGQSVSAGAAQFPNHVWGTPSHGEIKGSRVYVRGISGTSWVGFDTHSGGHDIAYRDCEVYVGLNNALVHGFASRCRRASFHRCRVFGNSGDFVVGFAIRGAESDIKDCEVEAAWMGIQYLAGFGGNSYSDHVAQQNNFSDLFGAAVRVQDAVGSVKLARNVCKGVRRGAASSGYRKTCLDFVTTGTGHDVTGNHVDFVSTDGASSESINTGSLTVSQIKIHGNYMRGYGANEMGHYSALVAPSVTIAAAYTSKNYTD